MDIVMRLVYLGALVAAAAVYTATVPPEPMSIWSLAKALIPATWIGLLFVLANGVLGKGMWTHIGALLLLVGVLAFVSMSLSATGLVTGVKTATGIISNLSNVTHALNISVP